MKKAMIPIALFVYVEHDVPDDTETLSSVDGAVCDGVVVNPNSQELLDSWASDADKVAVISDLLACVTKMRKTRNLPAEICPFFGASGFTEV